MIPPTRADPPEYKPTLFDRHGAVAGEYVRAGSYAAMAGIITFAAAFLLMASGGAAPSLIQVVTFAAVGATVAAATFALALGLSHAAGRTYQHLMMDGGSTPYEEQHSYQQALVMQGKLDEALASFEAVIAEQPNAVTARIRAAELYARDRGNPVRAAELFRDVQRIDSAAPGQVIYATNRLVDLLTGPLDDPGRALVELRRLIERFPGSAGAERARDALKALKARVHAPDAAE
ncbi:MAG TPA: tetratricopeptide repeat protein [Gemmatimonadaceae bacterium]|nr:tetratricopeptide repeat protein [Gemmatimonadaceae bacterium]